MKSLRKLNSIVGFSVSIRYAEDVFFIYLSSASISFIAFDELLLQFIIIQTLIVDSGKCNWEASSHLLGLLT